MSQLDFLEEASLLRLLRHRSIVGFAGVCVARGHGIILMVRLSRQGRGWMVLCGPGCITRRQLTWKTVGGTLGGHRISAHSR